MRIVVMSDCHGVSSPVEIAIERSKPDIFIYCGDGSANVEEKSYMFSDIKFYFVKGNCDLGDYPIEEEIKIGSKRVFFTHGHKYNVKWTYDEIIDEGKRRNADLVLFGHTHIPLNRFVDGMYLVNPGSASRPQESKPSYAFIEIVGDNIVTNIVEL